MVKTSSFAEIFEPDFSFTETKTDQEVHFGLLTRAQNHSKLRSNRVQCAGPFFEA